MAKREEEKKKRAEDPEEEGGVDASNESAEEEEREDESDDEDSDEPEATSSDDEEEEAAEGEKAAASDDDDEEEESRKSEPGESDSDLADEPKAAQAEEEDDAPPAQLGAQRYVMSAFFGGALLAAYLLGRAIDGLWLKLATRDWLVEKVPVLAAVPDDDKALYATIAGGVIALVVAIRTSRNPDVKQWSDDVSAELLKVKWPSRKEVYASTVVVLTTSAVAVVYLFLLDRFWGFVTNQIYGTGL